MKVGDVPREWSGSHAALMFHMLFACDFLNNLIIDGDTK